MTVSEPRVSVLLVTRNHARYIGQCLDSALAQQTDFPMEILVGVDGSTDETARIVRERVDAAAGGLQATFHEQQQGLARNLSDLWGKARGEYAAILEGDDYWTDPHKLQKQVAALDAHPDWAICFHRAQITKEQGGDILEPAEDDFPTESSLADLLRRNFIVNVSVMYRRGHVPEIPERMQSLVQQDWALHALHACHGKIGYLPEVMCVWRHHAQGMWTAASECQRWRWIFECYDAFEDLLRNEHRDDVRAARLESVSHLCTQWQRALQSRDFRTGRALLTPLRTVRRGLGLEPPPAT